VKNRRIFLIVVCILTRPEGSSKYSTTRENIRRYFTTKHLIYFYYPTVLVVVQKARETSSSITRYCTVGYCTVPCARSSCYTWSFLLSYWKRLKKVKLDNKSLIRCFGVKYRRIFLLVTFVFWLARSSKYSTTRTAILHTETSNMIYLVTLKCRQLNGEGGCQLYSCSEVVVLTGCS